MFKRFNNYYRDYYKNNPKGYWFKRKLFGWGWTPVKWQGWAVIGIWLLGVILFSLTVNENSSNREVFFTFYLPIILLTIAMIRICYKKGEKPKWQWGIPKEDDTKK